MISSNLTEVINRAEFKQFFEDVCIEEIEIVEELVADVRREGQELVDTILSSLKDEDLALLQRAAHTLKSSTKIFGGTVISDQACEIEELANPAAPGDFATVSNSVNQIQDNFDSFLLHLDLVVASKKR